MKNVVLSMKSRILRLLPVIILPLIIWGTAVPQGLKAETWHMFGVYIAILLGLVLRPYDDPVITLAIIGVVSIFIEPKVLLAGYGNASVWFILTAFLICKAFVITGLGKRIAFMLLKKSGKSTLSLGYIMVLIDTVLAPATASNMTRAAGITFPIFRNIAESLGSKADDNPRKIGSYFTILMYVVSMGTASLFLTGMATNGITVGLAKEVLKVNISWMTWMKAAILPAGLILIVAPFILYKLYTPELRTIENVQEVADKGLSELGPVKRSEKILLVLFILALAGWMTGSITGIESHSVALAFLSLGLLFGILTWESVISDKGAWANFIWYGGIFGAATYLASGGFYTWLVKVIQSHVDLSQLSAITATFVIVLVSVVVRYFFISSSAYVVSFFPVLFAIGLTTQAPPMLIALSLAFSASYGSLLAHYCNGAGVITFGSGYVPQKTFWALGTIMTVINMLVYFLIGIPYWKLIGLI